MQIVNSNRNSVKGSPATNHGLGSVLNTNGCGHQGEVTSRRAGQAQLKTNSASFYLVAKDREVKICGDTASRVRPSLVRPHTQGGICHPPK